MRRFRFLSVLVLLVLVGTVLGHSGAASASAGSGEIRWLTYTDPRYGFSVEYPADWEVFPRQDLPGHVGGSVIFSETGNCSAECGGLACLKVEIGLYLTERDPSVPLDEWSEAYDEAGSGFAPTEIRIESARRERRGGPVGREVFRKAGVSPLTEFTYVNIPYGRTVWFIWMNDTGVGSTAIFDHMASSLRFDKSTPITQV